MMPFAFLRAALGGLACSPDSPDELEDRQRNWDKGKSHSLVLIPLSIGFAGRVRLPRSKNDHEQTLVPLAKVEWLRLDGEDRPDFCHA